MADEEMDKRAAERLVLFSDAVIAIAITLLALELPVPSGATLSEAWRSFGEEADDYLAFLISFAVIGNQWLSHHSVFRYVMRTDRALLRTNLVWLLMIVLTPFATKLLVGDLDFAFAFTVYALVSATAALLIMVMSVLIERRGLAAASAPAAFYRAVSTRSVVIATGFLISIPVGFVTHGAYAIWAAVPILYGFLRRLVAARQDRRSDDHPRGDGIGGRRAKGNERGSGGGRFS